MAYNGMSRSATTLGGMQWQIMRRSKRLEHCLSGDLWTGALRVPLDVAHLGSMRTLLSIRGHHVEGLSADSRQRVGRS